MSDWMSEMRADKSTPIWVLTVARQLEELDPADAASGLEVIIKALDARCHKLTQKGSTIRGYLSGQY